MSELTPEIAADIVAACSAGAADTAGALSSALDGEFSLTVGEATTYDAKAPPEGLDGPGLVIVLKVGEVGAAALLPAATGLLPDWCAEPDATGTNKLNTLAQELSMFLVPETIEVGSYKASHVENLAAALTNGDLAEDASLVPLELAGGEQHGQMSLVWPLASPDEVIATAAGSPEAGAQSEAASETNQPAASGGGENFPPHTRSLLKIDVPVSVSLAQQRVTLEEVVELVPGSIISFNKMCDELSDLLVGQETVAKGSVVKTGDKFGLKIETMIVPQEHFTPLPSEKAS